MKKPFFISLKWCIPVLAYMAYMILMEIWFEVDILVRGVRHGGGAEFGSILLFVLLAIPLIPISYVFLVIADAIYTKNRIMYWIFVAFSAAAPIIFLIGSDYFYFGKIASYFYLILDSSMTVLFYLIPFFLMHYFVRKKMDT